MTGERVRPTGFHSVDHEMVLCHMTVRNFCFGKHFPRSDAVRPDVRFVRVWRWKEGELPLMSSLIDRRTVGEDFDGPPSYWNFLDLTEVLFVGLQGAGQAEIGHLHSTFPIQ